MTVEPERRVSLEEYLELERSSEEKHELLDGEVYAMGGASLRHNLVVTNLVAELRQKLRDSPCKVFPSDLRVQVQENLHYTYPDVTVVCDEPEFSSSGSEILTNPTMIFEVLSDSTEAYRHIPSLAEVVFVAQDRVAVELHARQPGGDWLTTYLEDPGDTLVLPTLGCELSVAEIYHKVGLPGPSEV